ARGGQMGNPFSRGGCISLKGHAQVSAVAFLPDGELVTAGGSTVRAWNLETGRAEKVWRFPGAVETCCCSPDGRYIACGVVDGLVFVYEARTWQQVAHWQAHADCGQGPLLQFFADSTCPLRGRRWEDNQRSCSRFEVRGVFVDRCS
ncbi:unnamed protein product, partial [Prorocentrum cordatum]